MKALITGITGFVGQYLARFLLDNGYQVWGTTRQSCPDLILRPSFHLINNSLLDEKKIIDLLNEIQPDQIYHLAGQSNVKKSWDYRLETFEANVTCTINLLEAIRKSKIAQSVKILTVGSAEEYGKVASEQMPINEETLLKPISPYGISKATVSFLTIQYHLIYGLHCVHARPFNHIGPGQSLGFVVTDFSKQIIDIEKGRRDNNSLYVGNLESYRDFTDVRDIVQAYNVLLSHKNVKFGEIYNVCSKKAVAIQEILNLLINLSGATVHIVQDMDRMRPSDIPLYIGDNTKIFDLDWKPTISLEKTLADVLQVFRNEE